MPSVTLQKQLKNIVKNKLNHGNFRIVSFKIKKNEQMLGFLGDYHYLRVTVEDSAVNDVVEMFFFVKSIPIGNASKAEAVRELGMFDKEGKFYAVLRPLIMRQDFRKWCPDFFGYFENDIVLEDLKAAGYRPRDKFKLFDHVHYKQAILCLASFHASSIIFEELQKKKHGKNWSIQDNFQNCLSKGGYYYEHEWFQMCMLGALQALKTDPKYANVSQDFEVRWKAAWKKGLDVTEPSRHQKNVLCHRDLWCNNILFHYDRDGNVDSCVFVDYQAVRCQPPAGDFMLLLCTNASREYVENNLEILADMYYCELEKLITSNGLDMADILTKEEFLLTLEEQRQWALIVSACLYPQMWMDEDKVTEIFSDADNYDSCLVKNKGDFIIRMCNEDSRYKEKVLGCFEEFAERYVL